MAKQLGTNVDAEDAAMVAARKEFEEKKKALADALARKARALADVEDLLGNHFFFFILCFSLHVGSSLQAWLPFSFCVVYGSRLPLAYNFSRLYIVLSLLIF